MKFLVSIFFVFYTVITVAVEANAQSSRSGNPNAIFEPAPSSRDPQGGSYEMKDAKKSKKLFGKKSFNRRMDEKVEEYEQRMKDNEKKYKKMEKEMKKPQYSDPMYFGHKHKPKKRPPGKQKFCKVCGIKH